jgi:Domain of unknown function (DUF4351)
MSQAPFDNLFKQYLEDFLAPIGTVERQYEIPGETKYVDVWFRPNLPIQESIDDLGLLRNIIKSPAVIEAYSNPPSRDEVDTCLLKRLWIKEEERRKRGDSPYPQVEQPMLWIIASHVSRPLLKSFHAHKTRVSGLYTLGPALRSRIIAIDELPVTEATLWLRILGRDEIQTQAIEEVVHLPFDHPRRNRILRLLRAWQVRLDISGVRDSFIQEIFMAYPQAFLDMEQATRDEGIAIGVRSLALRQLQRRFGELPAGIQAAIDSLSYEQVDRLGEALLDFRNLAELQQWIDQLD